MKLLSLLICLAMLLTGTAIAEQPSAVSTVVTVRDAVVRLQGQDYPLNPSIVFGAAVEDGSALLDFGVTLGEDVLFPVQAKIGESGAAVVLGSSGTAYTFTPEFFTSLLGGAEIPAEVFELGHAYGELIRASANLESTVTPEMNQALTEKLLTDASVEQTENVEFIVGDQTKTGTRYVFEIDADQMSGFMDDSYAQLPADFTEAYFRYMNAAFALTGGPEIASFGQLLDYIGMDMSLSGDMIANETSAAGDVIFHVTMDPSAMYDSMPAEAEIVTEEAAEASLTEAEEASIGIIGGADGPTSIMVTGVTSVPSEPVSFDIPMEITMHSPENVKYEISMEIEGIQMNISAAYHSGSITSSVRYDIPDVGSITVDAGNHPQEDGSVQTTLSAGADFVGGTFTLTADSAATDEGSSTAVNLDYAEDSFSCGASFTVDTANTTIEDRISAAEPKLIGSLDEAANSAGLMMAAMGLAGDAEPLLNDESVAALVAKVQEFFGLLNTPVPEPSTESVIAAENAELYEEDYDYADASAEANVKPFEAEFSWLPEGYRIEESYFDAEFSSYSATLLHEDDADYDYPVYVNIYSYDEAVVLPEYYSISDGRVQHVDGDLVQIHRTVDGDFSMCSAYASFGSYDVDLFIYGSSLADEDLVNILAGINIVEAAE